MGFVTNRAGMPSKPERQTETEPRPHTRSELQVWMRTHLALAEHEEIALSVALDAVLDRHAGARRGHRLTFDPFHSAPERQASLRAFGSRSESRGAARPVWRRGGAQGRPERGGARDGPERGARRTSGDGQRRHGRHPCGDSGGPFCWAFRSRLRWK